MEPVTPTFFIPGCYSRETPCTNAAVTLRKTVAGDSSASIIVTTCNELEISLPLKMSTGPASAAFCIPRSVHQDSDKTAIRGLSL